MCMENKRKKNENYISEHDMETKDKMKKAGRVGNFHICCVSCFIHFSLTLQNEKKHPHPAQQPPRKFNLPKVHQTHVGPDREGAWHYRRLVNDKAYADREEGWAPLQRQCKQMTHLAFSLYCLSLTTDNVENRKCKEQTTKKYIILRLLTKQSFERNLKMLYRSISKSFVEVNDNRCMRGDGPSEGRVRLL